jgi:hypothetical protein
MRDLSLHLLDIIENSAKAGAPRVVVDFVFEGVWLTVQVTDNGPGLAPSVKDDPSDPFRTTRRERKVGLGLALLRQAAEATGGRMEVRSPDSGGVSVTATFDLSHLDARPLGDLATAFLTVLLAWPQMDLVVRVGPNGEEILDSGAVRRELGDVTIGHPKVQAFLREQVSEGLRPLIAWAEKVISGAVGQRGTGSMS